MPKSVVRLAHRERKQFITFCTRACNLEFVAREGVRQQEALITE